MATKDAPTKKDKRWDKWYLKFVLLPIIPIVVGGVIVNSLSEVNVFSKLWDGIKGIGTLLTNPLARIIHKRDYEGKRYNNSTRKHVYKCVYGLGER